MRTTAWPVECRAVGVEHRPVDSLVARAARPGCVSAAVPEASLMAYWDFTGAEGVTLGQRVGGRVIHLPSVVCTRSPSTARSIFCGAVCDQLHIQPATRQPAPY
jgi:hypothetical protein